MVAPIQQLLKDDLMKNKNKNNKNNNKINLVCMERRE